MRGKGFFDNYIVYFISVWILQGVIFFLVFSVYYMLPTSLTGIMDTIEAERQEFLPLITYLRDDLETHPNEAFETSKARLMKRFIVPLDITSDDIPLPDKVIEQLQSYSIGYDKPNAVLYAYAPDQRMIMIGPMSFNNLRESGRFKVFALLMFSALLSTIITIQLRKRHQKELQNIIHVVEQLGDGHLNKRIPPLQSPSLMNMRSVINLMAARLENMIMKNKDMLRGMAHEFRTPLARMKLEITLLEQAEKQEKSDYLTKLYNNVDHMGKLSDAVLAYARASHTTMTLNREMVDTSSWIDRVIERVNDHPDYHISIETDIKLESIYIDPKFMDLVLENLLNNAAKYGADTARLTVKNQANAAVITVEDNGKGIPDNQKAEIFLPFVRLKGNDNVSGFGIGLSFVQAVVEMHNGSIKVMDNDMGGVTFLISLPLPIIEE